LNIIKTLFTGTLSPVGPGGAYIEDYIYYTDVNPADGLNYAYGLVKF